ncbi:MAG: Asp23/Gls24 family envelope stress response protein [Clostridia bacterium]|nr:Asp23/Gls24 family envelope stress response protein [Clostridia bacterium]
MEENNQELVENIEEIPVVEGNDTIKIANEAVATYAGIAVSEVSGVYGMAGGFASGITETFSGKKNFSKGIKVEVGEKDAKIDVSIIVEYGARIPEVAFEIQTRVKKAVENMTGLKVLEVNVHVQGVHAITEKDKEENQENEENVETNEE